MPGQFFMLEAPGPRAAAADEPLPGAARRARVPHRPDRPGDACALRARRRRRDPRPRAARQRLRPRRRAAAARRRRHRDRADAVPRARRSGDPPAILGFRTDRHAEAARLLPGAEVVVEPRLVTELLPDEPRRRPRVRAGADARGGPRARSTLRSSPGRRRWRAATARATAASSSATAATCGSASTAPCCGTPRDRRSSTRPGCLDALTAPDVARSLDAFVTKTVTPLRARETLRRASPRPTRGMLNSIGLQNPGIDAFLEQNLPRLAAARRPDLGLGRRLLARPTTRACASASTSATTSPPSS